MLTLALIQKPTTARRDLDNDDQGAVMVLGLFLALALIVCMGCVIGIGDAVLARDRSQEAADSAVFAGAVMHARGMNFIALINLVLLGWTLVYVFLCWVDLMLSFLLVLVTGIEQYQFTCALHDLLAFVGIEYEWCKDADRLGKFEHAIFVANKKVFEGLKKVGPPLFETQVFTAMALPYVGLFSSSEVALEYDRLGIAGSLSLIPGGGTMRQFNFMARLIDKIPGVQQPLPKKPNGSSGGAASLLQDRRIGLPVEAEPAYQLCIRGSRFMLENLKDWLGAKMSLGGKTLKTWAGEEPFSTMLYGVFQGVGEYNRAFFCSEKNDDWFKRNPRPSISKVQKRSWWSWKDYAKDAAQKLTGPMLSADRDVLRLTLKLLMFGIKGGSNDKYYLTADEYWRKDWPETDPLPGLFAGPKKVSPYAYNGTDWFQIWGFVGQDGGADKAAPIVSAAARVFNPKLKEQAQPGVHLFWAQAEFYFDCPNVWQSSQCNKGSAALYQMNWRARLRRVHSINVMGDLGEVLINNLVMGTLAKKWGQHWADKLGAALPNSINFSWRTEVGREAWVKAIRNDVAKVTNHRAFTGDHSSDELLH